MKKILSLLLCALMAALLLAGCGESAAPAYEPPAQQSQSAEQTEDGSDAITAPAEDVAMQYISIADAAAVLDSADYTFIDVRKAADYAASHIPGAISADMDAAKNGDFDAGVATMQAATKDLSNNLVIICYSGKSYAQATTNVLSAMGYDMSKVYTLEGGFNAWSETYPDNVTAE